MMRGTGHALARAPLRWACPASRQQHYVFVRHNRCRLLGNAPSLAAMDALATPTMVIDRTEGGRRRFVADFQFGTAHIQHGTDRLLFLLLLLHAHRPSADIVRSLLERIAR